MTKIKRLAAIVLAFLMIFSSVSVAASAWSAANDDPNNVSIRTEILRTEADGDLVVTDKVKKGETVKVRVYAETGYYTNAGTLLFFFNNNFFETAVSDFTVGPYYKALPIGMEAVVDTEATSSKERLLVALGVIDQTFADANNFVLINYKLDSQSENIQFNKDAVLFEMDLAVKSDVAAGTIGKFFIEDATVLSNAQQNGVVNIPKGPFGGYNSSCVSMNGWTPEFTSTDSQVELYKTPVSVTFDADGGSFTDAQGNKKSVEIMEGEAGAALEIEAPEKNNYKFLGWLASGSTAATQVTAFPTEDTTYTASWKSTVATDKTLAFKTEFYRFDGTDWVKTQRVKPGEEVQLRLFVDTSYYTNAGEIILFFDNDFFQNPTGVKENSSNVLTFNDDPASSAAMTGAHGDYMYISNKNFAIQDLVDNGCITSEFASTHGAYTLTYKFNPSTGNILSGDEWFASIPMIVNPKASGEGDCFIVDNTLLTPDREGYINIPVSAEGLDDDFSQGLWLWEVALTTESYPVSIESSITFDANGGSFAEGDPNTFVIEDVIGENIDATSVPEVSKPGSAFLGWAVEGTTEIIDIPAEMPHEDLKLVAQWISKVEITFNPNNGDAIYSVIATPFEPFVAPEAPVLEGNRFLGWTKDATLKTVTGLDETYPETATTYYAVFETRTYSVTYYVLSDASGKPEFASKAQNLYGDVIAAVPVRYEVPTGYELSKAYTDLTLTKEFVEGTTMPAENINLYYKLTAKVYNAEFDPNGGYFDGDETATASKLVPTAFEQAIVVPAAPEKAGYTFKGWTPTPSIMDEEGKQFKAIWEADAYTVEYYTDAGLYEAFDVDYNDSLDVPADPDKVGYTFAGWADINIAEPTENDIITPEALAATTMPMKNIGYKAVFVINKYNATFDAGEDATFPTDDDEDTRRETVEVTYDDAVTLPENPEKTGYTFTGWVDAENNAPGKMPAEDVTYTATWKVNQYTLVYVADGKELYNGEVDFGALVADYEPAADAVAKKGYEFTGWSGSPEFAADATMPAKTVTYYATYKANIYDTVFNAGEGTFVEAGEDGDNKTETVKTEYGEAIAVPELNDREGYDFAGWVDAQGNPVTVPDVMPDENLELTATWTPAKDTPYVVEYYTQGTDEEYTKTATVNRTGTTGAEVTADQNPPEGFHVDTEQSVLTEEKLDAAGNTVLKVYYARDEITVKFDGAGGVMNTGNGDEFIVTTVYLYGQKVSAPVPARTGYKFIGWDKDVVLIANEDATYTATWDELPFTVTYMANGEEVAEDTFDFTSPIVKNEIVPTLEGHNFAFWYETDENAEFIFGGAMPARNIVLNAKFNKGTFKAEFYSELTDEKAFTTTDAVFESDIKAPSTPPQKPGYEFAGWSTDGVNKLDSLGIMDEEGKTFYAVWTAKNVGYTVEYYLMKTDGTYDSFATDYDDTLTAPTDSVVEAVVKAIEHFEFDKENANNVLSETVAADGSTVLKLYYTRNQYTLTVNKDNGTDVQTNTYYYEQIVPAATSMNKAGYRFSHWVNAAGETVTYPTALTADMTLKAIWIANVHNLTYNIIEDDGTTTEWHSQKLDFGKPVYVPGNPAKVGYKFGGWLDADGKQPSDYGTMPDKDLVFTAQWYPDENVGYTLNIYEMDVNGNYPADPTTVLNFTDGVVGEERAPSIKVPAGFILDTEDVETAEKSNVSGTIPAPSVGKLVLNAYFQRNLWTLTTVVNGKETPVKYYYEAPVSVADPVVEGSKFLGWYDSAEYKTAVTIDPTMPNNDVTVFAKMEVQSYNVTFNAGNGTFENGSSVDSDSLPFGTKINAPTPDPVLAGYTFGGWALSTAPDVKVEDFGSVGEADVEYVAIWTKTAYSVKFYDYSNARGPAVSDEKYVYSEADNLNMGTAIPFPENNPAIENYVFLGWSETENGKDNLIALDATMPAEDLVLYAVYDRVAVMLIPEPTNPDCTTVIDRAGLTVDKYVEGESKWYVYGLVTGINKATLEDKYIDVSGDGHAEITILNENYGEKTGTGTIITVYDDVTGKIVETFRVIIFGDLNGDARIDATDDSMISDEIMGVTSWSYQASPEYIDYRKKAANLTAITSGDNRVDVTDGTCINAHVLGSARIVQTDGSMIYA